MRDARSLMGLSGICLGLPEERNGEERRGRRRNGVEGRADRRK